MDRRVSESFQQDQGVFVKPWKPLLLYMSVVDNTFRCVLGKHGEIRRKEQAIYYLSKKFTPCEAKYTKIEWTCCALTWIT